MQGSMFTVWLVACILAHGSAQFGPGAGPWQTVHPGDVGLKNEELNDAKKFVNANVLNRQCFLIIKDGKIAFEWYNSNAKEVPLSPKWNGPADEKPHNGYSMTKTVGGFLLLMAASEGDLDLDVDITQHYGVPSPKAYGVTTRMVMAQVLGGDNRPGEMWRYDNLGTDWLWVFPQIVLAATGKKPSHYMTKMQNILGLSKQFKFDTVDTDWFSGASGSCKDWARFGQLILNRGKWDNHQLIDEKYMQQMQEPVKVAPYEDYPNPCYGLLIWTNANKTKYPGCCWEASRLPEPHCNAETFMDGAVNDLTLNIGLYGQVVMTLPSVNTVVVGFGNDLRPIEPVQIGYYPGVCKALGIPCNKPPKVPKTKCGELLECTGVSAQCYSGGAWAHSEPKPGKEQCVQCFQNRLPLYQKRFPEAKYMVEQNCPQKPEEAMQYISCFCGLTGKEANPFSPWRTTTTTTLHHGPFPPLPPAKRTTPPPPGPPPACDLTPECIDGLKSVGLKKDECFPIERNGGHKCYSALSLHEKVLIEKYGCPEFGNKGQPVIQSKAFCWCGYDPTPKGELQGATWWNTFRPNMLSNKSLLISDPHDMCRDSHDEHILYHKPNLKEHMAECSHAKWDEGSTQDPADCMQKKTGLTHGCAECFGKVIHCSHQQCLSECACGETDSCHDCTKEKCQPDFDICAGDRRRRRTRRRSNQAQSEFISEEEEEPSTFQGSDKPQDNKTFTVVI